MANPYMPLFVGDYLKDTGQLTNEEHGVYLKLIMFMWGEGGALKNDARVLSRMTGVSYRRWPPIWANLERYFYVEGDKLKHTKVEKTLRKAREISDKRARAAAEKHKKYSKKNNKSDPANADANAVQMHAIQTKGLVSPSKEGEKPNLTEANVAIQEPSDRAADDGAPSALSARGLSPLPDCAREILEELKALRASGKISIAQMDLFRRAVRGERAGRVILLEGYKPPDAIAEIINRPKLKAIEGGKQ